MVCSGCDSLTSGSVHVVVSGDASLHGEVLGVGDGHLLCVELLQTVGILRPSRPRLVTKEEKETEKKKMNEIGWSQWIEQAGFKDTHHVFRETYVFRIHLERFIIHASGR